MLNNAAVFLLVTYLHCNGLMVRNRKIYVEEKEDEFSIVLNETAENFYKPNYGLPIFAYPQIKVLPKGFVLKLTNYSHFENDLVYVRIHFIGFLNLKIFEDDPEAVKDISGDCIRVIDDYVCVDNSTVLRHNDYLQIITEIDYFTPRAVDQREQRMNAFVISKPSNGTPPYGIFCDALEERRDSVAVDLNQMRMIFSTTTNRHYALPDYFQLSG